MRNYDISSVAQSCLTLCDPMNCSSPGLPVHHQLPEFTQTDVHWVGYAILPSHPLSSPSHPASVFTSITVFSSESSFLIRWSKYWSLIFNISPSHEYPGLISFRMDWLDLLAVQGTHKGLFQHHSSKAHPFYSLTKIFWHNISLPGFSVHGILQARILEWVSILFSRGIFLTQGLNSSPELQADSLPFETPGKPQDIRKKDQNWVKSMK